jgi:hypothetical protein
MTIKQQGGIFGRNPAFNDVEVNSLGIGTQAPTAVDLEINASVPRFQLTDADNSAYTQFLFNTGSFAVDVDPTEAGGSSKFTIDVDNVRHFELNSSGDLTLETGNLVIGTSGKGIDFSATAGTGTSELFDDYEEGTWTPTYTTNGTNFDSVTYDAVTSGNYTKIGNLVTLVARIRTDAITIGSASGSLVVGGLPFTPSANFGSSSVYASSFAASEPRVLTPATSGVLYLYKRTAADGADTTMTASEAGTGANQNTMYFTISYQTA